jgi:hypothetical protein
LVDLSIPPKIPRKKLVSRGGDCDLDHLRVWGEFLERGIADIVGVMGFRENLSGGDRLKLPTRRLASHISLTLPPPENGVKWRNLAAETVENENHSHVKNICLIEYLNNI